MQYSDDVKKLKAFKTLDTVLLLVINSDFRTLSEYCILAACHFICNSFHDFQVTEGLFFWPTVTVMAVWNMSRPSQISLKSQISFNHLWPWVLVLWNFELRVGNYFVLDMCLCGVSCLQLHHFAKHLFQQPKTRINTFNQINKSIIQ